MIQSGPHFPSNESHIIFHVAIYSTKIIHTNGTIKAIVSKQMAKYLLLLGALCSVNADHKKCTRLCVAVSVCVCVRVVEFVLLCVSLLVC